MSKNSKICPSCEAKAREVIDEEHELDNIISRLEETIEVTSPTSFCHEGVQYYNAKAILALVEYIKERL